MVSLKTAVHVVLLRPLVRLLFGLHIEGSEHWAGLGQSIVIANHNSHLDILLLYAALPVKEIPRTRVVAAEEYFGKRRWVFRLVTFLFDPVWICRNRETRNEDPLNKMRHVLAAGQNLIMFPEGSRGAPGELQAFKIGVGRLASEFARIPIVPVFLLGPERALPRQSVIPVPVWQRVIVGVPQRVTGEPEDIAGLLRTCVEELGRSLPVQRHLRGATHRQPALVVAVVGIDGSGKSTLSTQVARQLSAGTLVCHVGDKLSLYEHGELKPVQPLLQEVVRRTLSNYAKRAKSLKGYKLPKLAELLLRDALITEMKRWYRPGVVVTDGSSLMNMVGWSVLYRRDAVHEDACEKAIRILSGFGEPVEADDPIYNDFRELQVLRLLGIDRLTLPGMAVFLDVEPSVAISRIESRGEIQQVHETVEKLSGLRQGYRIVCRVLKDRLGVEVETLPGEMPLQEATERVCRLVNALKGEGQDE